MSRIKYYNPDTSTWEYADISKSPNIADCILVVDVGKYFTGTNVETVLQEIGSLLDGLDAALEELL